MKKYNKLSEVRMNQIRPKGWIFDFLKTEAAGMPGNLHKIGYPFDRACWQYRTLVDGGCSEWWPYEQTAYWIDSVVRTAIFTDDDKLFDVVKDQIEASFADDGDPFIGPLELKPDVPRNRWPHAVYFRALYALWSNTGDEKYLQKMRNHYLNDSHSYKYNRDVANIETMLKIAEVYDDNELYEKAVKAYDAHRSLGEIAAADDLLSDRVPNEHGVTFHEDAKLPAILYSYTGDREMLDASINGFKKIARYHMLPDGIPSSNEKTCGNESRRMHESCDISDAVWSLGYMLEATGDGKYADCIERAVFNALPGAVGPDFKTIQYFSCVNQVIVARNSMHLPAWKNTPRMAFQPHHYPECCPGNIGRTMPNYTARMYQTFKGGIAVSLYGDSVFDNGDVKILQEGNYPFGDEVKLTVTLCKTAEIKLKLRIPQWSKRTVLYKNGASLDFTTINGYAEIQAKDGDVISLNFAKAFSGNSSPDGGVYFTYGPLLLALKIRERIEVDSKEPRQTPDFPALNIYPESPWNYAVTGWERPESINVSQSESPFWKGNPLEIKIKAKTVSDWSLIEENNKEMGLVGGEGIDRKQIDCGASVVSDRLIMTPDLPESSFIEKHLGDFEEITLVPYGCTNIRLTVFPKYKRED